MNIIDDEVVDNKFYKVPIVIDVTLYKYNYIDNIIISQLKRGAFIMADGNVSNFSVSANEFRHIFNSRFATEISKLNAVTNQNLHSTVNSIYFLNQILTNFVNLEMINVHISHNRNFTRLFNVNDTKVIGFDYKVKQGILDYPKYMSFDLMERFEDFIKVLDIVDIKSFTLDPYYIISARNIISKLGHMQENNPNFINENSDLVDLTYEMIEPKLEDDNTFLILKLDFMY